MKPSILWSRVSVSVPERMDVHYLKSIVFISTVASYALFQRYYNYFYIRLVAIHFFNCAWYFSDVKICSHSLFPSFLIFFSAYFGTPLTVKQISHPSRSIFRAHWLYWYKSSYFFEAATFSQKDNFYRTLSRLEQLRIFNNYFLVTNTFSDQLLFEDKHSFSTAAASEELLLNK